MVSVLLSSSSWYVSSAFAYVAGASSLSLRVTTQNRTGGHGVSPSVHRLTEVNCSVRTHEVGRLAGTLTTA
jgi:hypothetical protein